jgi:hypothetical protein
MRDEEYISLLGDIGWSKGSLMHFYALYVYLTGMSRDESVQGRGG